MLNNPEKKYFHVMRENLEVECIELHTDIVEAFMDFNAKQAAIAQETHFTSVLLQMGVAEDALFRASRPKAIMKTLLINGVEHYQVFVTHHPHNYV